MLPVLFVHGIGIGLYPYTNMLHDIKQSLADSQDGEVGIIALEIMPISFRITHPALSKDDMVAEIQAILKHHGWEKVILVTHSYGSTIATHLINSPSTQKTIGPIVLIDPITFLLHLPDVAYNFTARKPVHANEYQLWYFASQDPGISHTLKRRFFWSENIIWLEQLGQGAPGGERGVTVVMAGQDLIVDTKAVSRYLLSPTRASFRDSSRLNGHSNGEVGGHANGSAENLTIERGSSSKDSTMDVAVSRTNRAKGQWKSLPWKTSGLNLLWFEHLDHAQVFDSAKSRRLVAQAIRRYTES